MADFRIEVFLSVAKNLSFTKASNEMLISQPAISKHIRELESSFGVQLFSRANNKVTLTQAGEKFLQYAEEIHNKYKELNYEMNLLCNRECGKLVIGASTTISQYLLPIIISKFKDRFPDVNISLISGNSEYIENLVANNTADLGIVEGATHKKEYEYTSFIQDELVLITSSKGDSKKEINLEDLVKLPMVIREEGSGTLDVIDKLLRKYGIKIKNLNTIIKLGSTEAIKRFVRSGNSYAIVSIAAVTDELKRKELTIVKIKDIKILREFTFITNKGSQVKISSKFIEYALLHHNF